MIPARETIYRGTKMRSRLEARFAGMLDFFGLDWEYEPQAFAAGATQYLPDFRIQPGVYVEVRPFIEHTAFDRMGVILESEPDAWLAIACPKIGRLLAISTPKVAAGIGALGAGVMPFGPNQERRIPETPDIRGAFLQQIGRSLADVAVGLAGLVNDAGWGWETDRGAA